MFGALAATDALPFDRTAFESAIRASGRGVASSLRAFAAAFDRARQSPIEPVRRFPDKRFEAMPDTAGHPELDRLAERIRSTFPPTLQPMLFAGVRRLVLASSMVVYGQGRYGCPEHGSVEPLPRRRADLDAGIFEHRCPECGLDVAWLLVDEDTALRPRSLYAASKVAQEHYALAWSEATGGSVVALRYHNVYGPGMPRDTPYSGVAAIFRSALEKGGPPRVFEDGGQMRDFVYVDDVAAANLAAASSVAMLPPCWSSSPRP